VFHVINRAINRQWILSDDADKQFFLDLLVRFKAGYALEVYHWAVMANHFHLAIETLTLADLSSYIGKVQRRFTTYHHARYGGCGPLWVRRFKSVLVQKEGYLGRLGRYIERNGLRAGAVDTVPWDYRFCSAPAYVTGCPDRLIAPARHPTWGDLSESQHGRRQAYRNFLVDAGETLADERLFRSEDTVIGDEGFRDNARKQAGRKTARGRGRRRSARQ